MQSISKLEVGPAKGIHIDLQENRENVTSKTQQFLSIKQPPGAIPAVRH